MRIGIGETETVEVPPHDGLDIWEFHPNRGRAVADAASAAEQAVRAPQDFPSVAEAIVGGDRITLAADANCPEIATVLLGVVRGIPLAEIEKLTVVLSSEANEQTVDEVHTALAAFPDIAIEVHDPTAKDCLAYLAANTNAEPIYFNRQLTDADLVIPVITARPAGSLDPWVMDGGVFPAFADAATQKRLRSETLDADGTDDREASEAAWLLGIQFLVAVIPTADARVAAITAGTPAGIRRVAEHAIEASWQRDISRKADLVFACLDGNHQQQSWDNVARALHVARHLVRPGGTIVVTSHLRSAVAGALRRLTSNQPAEQIQQQLTRDKHRDALAAALILQLRQEGRVLLLSHLPVEQVEALGIGAVENPQQLLRLIDGHESCAIIRAAQFCGVGVPK